MDVEVKKRAGFNIQPKVRVVIVRGASLVLAKCAVHHFCDDNRQTVALCTIP